MESAKIVQNPIFVIGISLETKENKCPSAEDIDQLWQKFYSENIYAKIPSKANDTILAVRHTYSLEADQVTSFRYILGCEVTSLAVVPDGMNAIEIKASTFAQFPVTGKFPEALDTTWQSISKSLLKRMYSDDIEIYSTENGRPDFKTVYILVSIE